MLVNIPARYPRCLTFQTLSCKNYCHFLVFHQHQPDHKFFAQYPLTHTTNKWFQNADFSVKELTRSNQSWACHRNSVFLAPSCFLAWQLSLEVSEEASDVVGITCPRLMKCVSGTAHSSGLLNGSFGVELKVRQFPRCPSFFRLLFPDFRSSESNRWSSFAGAVADLLRTVDHALLFSSTSSTSSVSPYLLVRKHRRSDDIRTSGFA